MIPITPDIVGPGIEEEYADAMERITFLLDAFEEYPPANDNFYGRIVYQLLWLRQEIEAQRLPIPVDRSYIGTLTYLVGSGDVNKTQEIRLRLGELTRILQGPGLIKPRHYPVVVAQIEDFLALVIKHVPSATLLPVERDALEQFAAIAGKLLRGEIELPVSKQDYPAWLDPTRLVHFNNPHLPNGGNERRHVALPVFGGWRPYPAEKPLLPAPNPGLDPRAPDMTLMRDLINTKTS
jgi:hypothetical protein